MLNTKKIFNYFISAILLSAIIFPRFALAIPDTPQTFDNLFLLPKLFSEVEDGLLAYSQKEETAYVLRLVNGVLKTQNKIRTPLDINAATTYINSTEKQIVIAYGYGRRNLNASINIKAYAPDLSNPKDIFNTVSARSEVTFLGQTDSKLLVNFFTSKYFTALGLLEKDAQTNWKYQPLAQFRMGSNIASYKNFFLVGRPYGDALGVDGDAWLLKGEEKIKLPTFRGVSAVAFLPSKSDWPDLLVGDGWHQNYASEAKALVSLLSYNPSSKAWQRKEIEKDSKQYRYTSLIPVINADRLAIVLAAGNLSLKQFNPAKNWSADVLYTAETDRGALQTVVLKNATNFYAVVLDNYLKLIKLSILS